MTFDPQECLNSFNLAGDTAGSGATHSPGIDAVCRPMFNSAAAVPSITPDYSAKIEFGGP
ncbi:MAG: hypothetical protein KTR28_01930 [Micavibrio sp.]|nr:hypothetical protein [Micavibrio sp.]